MDKSFDIKWNNSMTSVIEWASCAACGSAATVVSVKQKDSTVVQPSFVASDGHVNDEVSFL